MNEKTNTARILKDEPLLVTSWWCRLGVHTWTRWSSPSTSSRIENGQVKVCIHCNEYAARRVNIPH